MTNEYANELSAQIEAHQYDQDIIDELEMEIYQALSTKAKVAILRVLATSG